MKHFIHTLWFGLLAIAFTACTADEPVPEPTTDVSGQQDRYVYDVDLHGDCQDYGDQTRAVKTWKNGDKILFDFWKGNDLVMGEALYSSGKWTLTTDQPLEGSGTCWVGAFDDADYKGADGTVYLKPTSAVYTDSKGQWSVSDNRISVSANLAPKLGRLRFKGTVGTTFTLNGITTSLYCKAWTRDIYPNWYDPVTVTIHSSGYSDYIYGEFNSSTSPSLTANGYTMDCSGSTTMMQPGHSGWLNVPTDASHTGWTKVGGDTPTNTSTRTFTANGVSFAMVLVEAGTFTMGATPEQVDPYSSEKPAHQVTLTKDYYMGETEVTQGLWEAVMGQKPTSDGYQWSSTHGLGANYPGYYISWDDVQSFLTKLNSLTGQQFRIPTEAEWEYAARGGKKSQGYQYSGGNTIGDVAWYGDNSGSKKHEVKTRQANELGLYDMSGNVWEWCADWYSSSYYTSAAVTDPTGPTSGSDRVLRGGSWNHDATNCRVANRLDYSSSARDSDFGFRLAL